MDFLNKLFGKKHSAVSPSNTTREKRPPTGTLQEIVTDLPWQWSTSTSKSDCGMLLQNLRNSLPAIFETVDQPGRDPVFVLVDVGRDENRMWRSLIYLLFKDKVYYSPEKLTGQSPQSEVVSSGDRIYKAPVIGGKQLKVGIYAVERNNLSASLSNIARVPPPMLIQVLKACPSGMFTVAFFCDLSLGIKHVSRDAKVDKLIPF